MDEDEELSSPRVPAFDVAEVGPGNVSVSAFAAAICVSDFIYQKGFTF